MYCAKIPFPKIRSQTTYTSSLDGGSSSPQAYGVLLCVRAVPLIGPIPQRLTTTTSVYFAKEDERAATGSGREPHSDTKGLALRTTSQISFPLLLIIIEYGAGVSLGLARFLPLKPPRI